MLRMLKKAGRFWGGMRSWMNWRQKIRTKMFLAVFAVFLLPLTIFTFLTLRMGTSYVLFDAAQENHDQASQTAAMIDQYYQNKFESARTLTVQQVETLAGSAQARSAFLSAWLDEIPDLLAASLTTDAGDLLSFTPREHAFAPPFALRGASGWSGPRNGLAAGPLLFPPETPSPVVPIAVTLPRPRDGREMVLTGYFNLAALEYLMRGLQFKTENDLYLEDAQGTLIFHSRFTRDEIDNQHTLYSIRTVSPRLSRIIDNSTFSVVPYVNERRLKVLGAYARCPVLGWGIFLERSAEMPFRRITNLRIIIHVFTGLTFLFSLVGGVWFISRLVQPIEDLEAGIKLVSSGLMGDELPIRSQDEIGRLTQTFNQMTRTLVLRTEEIRAKTRELTFFNTITRIINQWVDLNVVLDNSLQKILQLLHATAGMIYIYQPVVKQLKLSSYFGISDPFAAAEVQQIFAQGAITKVYASGEPQLIREVSRLSEPHDVIRQENLRDLLLVPLRSKKRTLGVLAVGSRRRHTFHYRDLDLLVRIGDEIGVAVENSLLYAELQLKIKELEEANRDLQELDRFKSRFLSNVSHELRTPITSIKTYIELFLGGKIGALDDLQKDKLLIVRRNVNNLLTLINDLLTLSRVEGQKSLVAGQELVSIQELADQVIADTVEIAKSKGLQLQRVGLREPAMIRVSRQGIQQVLQNLISNAIKFTDKGKITVAIEVYDPANPPAGGAPVPAAETEEHVLVSVIDTGIGIPPEELGKVFQRFYQVDSSSTRKYVGTGLGLAIVKEILTSHHSAINVESQVGRGSRFWFVLPIISAPPAKTLSDVPRA